MGTVATIVRAVARRTLHPVFSGRGDRTSTSWPGSPSSSLVNRQPWKARSGQLLFGTPRLPCLRDVHLGLAELLRRSVVTQSSRLPLPAKALLEDRPRARERDGKEEYFLIPYPSPAVQITRRTALPGRWFKDVSVYPIPAKWTEAPTQTWPPGLRSFWWSLSCSDSRDAERTLERLEQVYTQDTDVTHFCTWVRCA